ncbi:ABC transporter permease [Candidatus Woesearchaeota archaeon]|nr:ABC transporter permease [Candidatus Woesearchaeota archaeon]
MRKILEIIRKNFKILMRSKISAAIIVLGPLVLMLLVGAAFNTSNIYDIRIAAYSDSYTNLSNSIVDLLSDQQFKVTKIDNQDGCINSVRQAENHICVVFPSDLSVETEGEIQFYVDQSRINLIWVVIDAVSKKVSVKSEQISQELTQVLVDNIAQTKNVLGDKTSVLKDLTSNSADAETKLRTIGDGISEIDLSSNITDVKDLENISKELQAEFNSTGGNFKKLDDLLTTLKTQVSDIQSKIDSASNTLDSKAKEISDLKSTVSSNTLALKGVKDSVDSLVTGINAIQITDVESIVSPIKTKVEPVSTDKTHLSFLFPALLVLVIMFVSILLASTIVIKEKLSKASFRNYITPTSSLTFIFGTYLTNILIVIIQLVVLFAVIGLFFQKDVVNTLANASILLLIIATIFIFIGMIIGYAFNSEETSTLGSIAIGSIFLIFSNTILPIESIPETYRQIFQFNPFILSEGILKKIMIFKVPLLNLTTDLYILGGYILGLFVLLLIVERATQKAYLVRKFIVKFRKLKK